MLRHIEGLLLSNQEMLIELGTFFNCFRKK